MEAMMNPRQTSSDSKRLVGVVAAGVVLIVVPSDDVTRVIRGRAGARRAGLECAAVLPSVVFCSSSFPGGLTMNDQVPENSSAVADQFLPMLDIFIDPASA